MKYLLTCLAIIPLLLSCHKDEDPNFIGGKGGNAVLILSPRHHLQYINQSVVYIKYNATNPATPFDDSATCVNLGAKPIATFRGLKKGNYYIYSVGYDSSAAVQKIVHGGISYSIDDETVLSLDVPVSE